jgi:hypothetical protein
VLEKPDRTIAELTAAYVERTSRTAGTSTIWRAVSPPVKLAPTSTGITGLHAPTGGASRGPRRAPLVA